MEERKESDTFVRSCIVMASIVIIIAGLRAAQAIVAPFMIAVFAAITLSPAVLWLTRHRVPTVVSILIVVLAIFIVGAGTGIVVGTSINVFTQNLPLYEGRIRSEAAALIHMADRLGISIPEKGILGLIDPGAAFSLAANLLRGFGNLLGKALVILLIVIFMLLEVSEVPTRLRRALGRPNAEFGWFGKFTENLRRYLAIKTWVSLATGLSVAVWLWILGVDFPFLWGLLAFLMNYIPNIGSIIAAIPAVALSIIQLGWGSALLVVIGYAACNLVFGTIVEPRFLGRGLGMSTLIVFLSLLFWGWVLGPVGLFLSVPLTMTVIIALNSKPETQWIPVILGSGREK
jgi:AI-2 transport protein TqsA